MLQTFKRKGHDDLIYQALIRNHTGKRKPGRPITTRRRDLLREFEYNEISSVCDASSLAKPKED